jgi:hypothetical protein
MNCLNEERFVRIGHVKQTETGDRLVDALSRLQRVSLEDLIASVGSLILEAVCERLVAGAGDRFFRTARLWRPPSCPVVRCD